MLDVSEQKDLVAKVNDLKFISIRSAQYMRLMM